MLKRNGRANFFLARSFRHFCSEISSRDLIDEDETVAGDESNAQRGDGEGAELAREFSVSKSLRGSRFASNARDRKILRSFCCFCLSLALTLARLSFIFN